MVTGVQWKVKNTMHANYGCNDMRIETKIATLKSHKLVSRDEKAEARHALANSHYPSSPDPAT